MSAARERFFTERCFAVVGHSELLPFPTQACRALRELGRTAWPVDLGGSRYIGGAESFASLAELPGPFTAAVLALPRPQALRLAGELIADGIRKLWVEEGLSPELTELCQQQQVDLCSGPCLPGSSWSRLRRRLASLLRR